MNECPNCGEPFDKFNIIVDEEYSGHIHYDYCICKCQRCGKEFRWTEVFEFTEVQDIEEVTDS